MHHTSNFAFITRQLKRSALLALITLACLVNTSIVLADSPTPEQQAAIDKREADISDSKQALYEIALELAEFKQKVVAAKSVRSEAKTAWKAINKRENKAAWEQAKLVYIDANKKLQEANQARKAVYQTYKQSRNTLREQSKERKTFRNGLKKESSVLVSEAKKARNEESKKLRAVKNDVNIARKEANKAYKAAKSKTWDDYKAAKTELWKAYKAARSKAWQDYQLNKKTLGRTEAKAILNKTRANAKATFNEAKAAAKATFNEARAKAKITLNKARAKAKAIYDEAKAKAKVAQDAYNAERKRHKALVKALYKPTDKIAPTAPSNLEAVSTTEQITLSWTTSFDNKAVSAYEVQRDGSTISAAAEPSYIDTNVTADTTYQYQVFALDAAGNRSEASETISAQLEALTTLPEVTGQALAETCSGCHGTDTQSQGPDTPSLAGMSSDYLQKTMSDFKDGSRHSTMMGRIAKAYNEDEIRLMGDWIESLSLAPSGEVVNLAKAEEGKSIHETSCSGCHGNEGTNTNNGILAKQWSGYLHNTLNDFAEGRSTSAPDVMINAIKNLSDADREALTHYYASFGGEGSLPSAPINLTASNETDTSVTLSWETANDNHEIASYEISRKGVVVYGTTLTSVIDDELESGKSYSYSVVAIDTAGNRSDPSEILVAQTTGLDQSVIDGLEVWQANNCAACHGQAKSFFAASDLETLTSAIQENRGGMGQFDHLTAEQLSDLVAYVQYETDFSGEAEPSSLDGVLRLDNVSTLRKALVLLAGRLPTSAEYQQAETDEGLRQALKNAMEGSNFTDFVTETGDMHFQTKGLAGIDQVDKRDWLNAEDKHEDDMRSAPIELLNYIVSNDRSYKEILTADYTMVNPSTQAIYGAELLEEFTNSSDSSEHVPARIPVVGYSNAEAQEKTWPHSGVLTMPAWLTKFPTTHTNRNRHRANTVFKQFLGIDIESLGTREIDDSDLDQFTAPLLEAPACMTCHTTMDPVAGAFQNWFDKRGYRLNGYLDPNYRNGSEFGLNYEGSRWYESGDRWYRDALDPGFGSKKMPGGALGFNRTNDSGIVENAENDNGSSDALQWLAREIVDDPRFATGAVKFWFKGVFGRDPVTAPAGQAVVNYDEKLKQFQDQEGIIEDIANRFSNDGYIVRDLLVEMVMSDLFRAISSDGSLDETRSLELEDLGMGRMLSTQQLQRKAIATVGTGLFSDITTGVGIMYGGYDGGNLSATINQDMNPVMYSIVENLVVDSICNEGVINKFMLDTSLEDGLTFLDTEEGRTDIKQHIKALHWELLGERLSTDSQEINRTFRLYEAVFMSEGDHTSQCDTNGDDPNRRAWAAVGAYLMTDIKYFTE